MVIQDRTHSTRAITAAALSVVVVVSSAACSSSSPRPPGRPSETSASPMTRAAAAASSNSAGGPVARSSVPSSVTSSAPVKSTVVPTVAPPASTSGSPTGTAQAAATRWARAWCGWDYRRPYLARERAARALMTPAGAQDLEVTPAGEWQSEVVAVHQVSVCTGPSVHFAEGGGSARLAYVRMAATRTVTDDNGVTTSPFLNQRRVVLQHGRWLVDQRVQGG